MKSFTMKLQQQIPGLVLRTAMAAALCVGVTAFSAEVLVGSATGQRIVMFSSDSPGDVAVYKVTGLQAGEEILGVDQRPATAQLYALGSSSRLYTIDLVTSTATEVGTGPFTPALNGTSFGFDFNPTVDRIRIVSNNGDISRTSP